MFINIIFNGYREYPVNYRPITIVYILGKIFEETILQ